MKPRARNFIIATLGIVVLFAGCEVRWRVRHPAPLGRSKESVTERLRRAIPPGTSRDSVLRYFAAIGVTAVPGPDSLTIRVTEYDAVSPRPFPADISVVLSFDGTRRLTATKVERWINGF